MKRDIEPKTNFEIMTKDLFCCSITFNRPNQLNNHYRQCHNDLPITDPTTWPDIIIRNAQRHRELGSQTWLRYIPFPKSSKDLTWAVAAPPRSAGTREERRQWRCESKRSDRVYKHRVSILKSKLEHVQHRPRETEEQALFSELNEAYRIAAECRQSAVVQAHNAEELAHVERNWPAMLKH
jgi:hypothetical protein